jgi:hypothetical protein
LIGVQISIVAQVKLLSLVVTGVLRLLVKRMRLNRHSAHIHDLGELRRAYIYRFANAEIECK